MTRQPTKKNSFLTRVLIFANSAIAFLLLASYMSAWVDPKFFWPIAMLGIAYTPLLILNTVFFCSGSSEVGPIF